MKCIWQSLARNKDKLKNFKRKKESVHMVNLLVSEKWKEEVDFAAEDAVAIADLLCWWWPRLEMRLPSSFFCDRILSSQTKRAICDGAGNNT